MKKLFLCLLCLTSLQFTGCITFFEKEYVPAPDPEANSFATVVSVQGRSLVLGDGRCVDIAGLDISSLSDNERKTLERSLTGSLVDRPRQPANVPASGVLVYPQGKRVHVEVSQPLFSYMVCGFRPIRVFSRKIPRPPMRVDIVKERLRAGLARLNESEVPDPAFRQEYREEQNWAQAKHLGIWATPGEKLIQAVRDGDLFEVDRLLNAGSALNAPHGKESLLPLEAALNPNRLEMVQYLLLRGADVNASQGAALRRLAIWGSDSWADVARLLLDRGADVKLADDAGPLLTKSALGRLDVQTISLLMDRGAKLDVKEGGPILLRSVARNGRADLTLARKLLDMGVDIEASDDLKQTPLLHAVYAHNLNMARLLLDRGATVNYKDRRRSSPLWVARSLKDTQMVDLLKAHGARD